MTYELLIVVGESDERLTDQRSEEQHEEEETEPVVSHETTHLSAPATAANIPTRALTKPPFPISTLKPADPEAEAEAEREADALALAALAALESELRIDEPA